MVTPVIASGRAEIRSLSPATEFGGRDDDYALFYAFQRAGAVEVLVRGPGRLKAFAGCGSDGVAFLTRLNAATRIGNFVSAFRKLNLEPAPAFDALFDLYSRGEVRLVRSPDNVLLFRPGILSAERAQQIADDINVKIEARLERFRTFKGLIESSVDPTSALHARFAA
jgi:hypothetical protein